MCTKDKIKETKLSILIKYHNKNLDIFFHIPTTKKKNLLK